MLLFFAHANKIKKERNKEIILLVGIFFIFITPIVVNFDDLNIITILNDEFGYWGNAALLVGIDWKPLMSETPYYSLGYSLLLTPLFLIFNDFSLLYKIAIILNIFFLFLMLLIAYKIVVKLFKVDSIGLRLFLCIISTLTVFNIYQSRSTWPEVLLSLLMWISVWFINKIENNPKEISNYICIVIVYFYMCIVHKRTIPVVLVGSILILFWGIRNNLPRKTIILGACIFICVIFVYILINAWHSSSFYGSAGKLNNESIQKMAHNYGALLIEYFDQIWRSFVGKCAVNLVGTYFVAPIVVLDLFGKIKYKIDGTKDRISLTEVYVVCSFCIMLMLVTLQCSSVIRKDTPVYSRYSDFTLGPIILYGMYNLIYKKKSSMRILGATIIGFLVIIINTFEYISRINSFFNVPCSPIMGGIFYFVSKNGSNQVEIDTIFFLFKICFLILAVVLVIIKKQNIILALVILFITNAWILHYSNEWLDKARNTFRNNSYPLSQEVLENDSNVYFVKQEDQADYCIYAKYLQFWMRKRTISTIDESEINNLPKDVWIVTNTSWINSRDNNLKLIDKTKTLTLYKKE